MKTRQQRASAGRRRQSPVAEAGLRGGSAEEEAAGRGCRMKGAGFEGGGSKGGVGLLFISSVFLWATGKPLQDTPGQVYVAEGIDGVLSCGLDAPLDPQVTTVEWQRVDGPSVAVLRHGEVLVKDQAPDYRNRTSVLKDGSLRLLKVRRRDNGTYRCILLRSSSVEKEVTVSLHVVVGSEVNLLLWRTAANQLLVLCRSSGWSPKPLVSVLDWRRAEVPTVVEPEVQPQPNGLFSVSVRVDVETVEAPGPGEKSVVCRVEVPGHLVRENTVSITDDFLPPEAEPGWSVLAILAVLLAVTVMAAVRYFARDWRIKKFESLTSVPLLSEYGHMDLLVTDGASAHTARAKGLTVQGIDASNLLAQRDAEEMKKYKDSIFTVGQTLGVAPALIAAIISRQSEAGTTLRQSGYGQGDPNCFGLMQINQNYHAVKGSAYSSEHIDQGVTFLIQLIKTMRRSRPEWSKEQQLRGALACYIAGEDKVLPLDYNDVDSVTPNQDFSSDVVARARWFTQNGF